jgi:hypothetical protein
MSFMDVMYGPLGQVNNQFQNNLGQNAAAMNASNAYLANQQNQMAGWNAQAAAAAQPTPYGYGFVGGYPSFNEASGGGGDVWSQGAPAYNDYGGAADIDWMLGGSQGQRPSEAYNAPRQYGWETNEGAPVPQQTYQPPMGEFRPQTYGWDANEGGVNNFGGDADIQWYLGGSQGSRPSENAPRQYGWDANEGATVPQQPVSSPKGEFNPQTYGWDANEGGVNDFGGAADQTWVQGGSQGSRPSSGQAGSDADLQWYLGGSQGPRPSAQPDFDSIWHRALPLYMPPTSPSTVTVPQQQGSLSFGGPEDIAWMQGGSQGPRPSNPGDYGGRDDIAWMLAGSQGPRPSSQGGGYDMSAQSRSVDSPLQGFDWAQSYGTRGGQNADMLRAAGGASSGYYNPELDRLSQSTLGMGMGGAQLPSGQIGGENTNTYGYPGSGYLGAGGIYTDPFGAYVPQGAVGPEGLGGNYAPRYDAQQGFQGGA